MAAKKKEVEALKGNEFQLKRIGELCVEIVRMKNDLGDTGEAIKTQLKCKGIDLWIARVAPK